MNKYSADDDCEIVGGVILCSEFALRPEHKNVELKWTIQLFNGKSKYLYFDLDMVDQLFSRFCYSRWVSEPCSDFAGCVLQVLLSDLFKETCLGTVQMPGNVKAIRNSIHDEWLYL